MENSSKTKKQLLGELEQLRKKVNDFESANPDFDKTADNKRNTEKKYRNLEILNTITQAIHESFDIETLYEIAVNKIIELESVDMVFIYLVEVSDTKQAVLHAYRNVPEDYISRAGIIPYPKGVTWKVINSGEILIVENFQKDESIGPAGRDLGHHSSIGIPIFSGTETIGVIWIASYKEQTFNNQDIELLSSIGNQISVAIAKSGLYEELAKKKRYEEIIKTVIQSVHKSINLQDVFENAVEAMNENIEVASNVSIYMAEGKQAVLKASRGFPDWFKEKIESIPYPKGFTWKTIIEGELIYCPDVDKDEVIGAAGRKLGTKSYVSIPVSYEGKTVGSINVHCFQKHGFDEEDKNMLETISHQIAVAIKNAQQAEALRQSEEKYRNILDNANDLIQSVAPGGSFLYVNSAWENKLGYSIDELKDINMFDIIHPDYRDHCIDQFQQVLKGNPVRNVEAVFVTKNGRTVLVSGSASCNFVDGKALSIQGIFRDITDHKRLEQERIKSQKLESVGVLAGGIAHDFNNLLTVIQGNIYLAMFSAKNEEERLKILKSADDACVRAEDLTNQLLTFSKGGTPVKILSSIDPILRESANFALTGSNVKCEFSISKDVSPVEIDKGQINQVIHNIIINADHAMPKGGIIKVTAKNFTAGYEHNDILKKGNYIKITIEDRGIGIPKELIHKIFDPFFTTKQKGSGLGLATSYSIIKNHGGDLTVESDPGKGTVFNIYLPASEKGAPSDKQDGESVVKGKGRILLMDDDIAVSNLFEKLLIQFGYEVELASDGSQAVEIYKEAMKSGRIFDAIILDLTVPGGLGGKETMELLIEIDPDIKAIVTSGYSNDPVMSDYKKYGFKSYISKPFNIGTLSKILDDVISN